MSLTNPLSDPTTEQLRDLILPGMYRYSGEKVIEDGAVYPKIFKTIKSEHITERSTTVRILGLAKLSERERWIDPHAAHDREFGQRYIWSATADHHTMIFGVVPDEDRRAVPVSHASFLTETNDGDIRSLKPVALRDFKEALAKLVTMRREAREERAAALFNTCDRYDPMIGGDGVSMCSTHHPYDYGIWANTFITQQALNQTTLDDAARMIGEFVDEGGVKILIKPKALLVPKQLAAVGLAAVAQSPFVHDIIVWPALKHPFWWWILTDTGDALIHYIRTPFELDAWADIETDMVLIKAYDRDTFSYRDPRGVFGSMPLD